MRRFLFIASLTVILLLAVTAGIAAWLLNDEAFLKGQLEKYALKYTGRELAVSGPLEISLGRETTFEASGVTFSNASWSQNPDMLAVGHVKATIEIPSLFGDLLYLPYLHLEDCSLEILENTAGVSNWDFPGKEEEATGTDEEEGLLPFALNDLLIKNCRLLYDTPDREQALDVRIASAKLNRELHDRIVGEVDGSVNGKTLEVDGWLAPASAFVDGGELRHELSFRAGEVTLDSSGSVADVTTFSGPDFQGRFQGPDIGRFLRDYSLPPLAEGAFDFRLGIATRDGMIYIDLDGDLGNLDIDARGEMDRLLDPGKGHASAAISGPNLRAVGQALGLDGMVMEPFTWEAEARFLSGAIEIDRARLETDGDRLALSGTVKTGDTTGGGKLSVRVDSSEIGRWAPLAGEEALELGALSADGELWLEPGGVLYLDAIANHAQSGLSVHGAVGALAGPLEPDLNFEFHSSDMPKLAALIGYQGFPARPFMLKGRARKTGNEVRLSDLELMLNRSTATASGKLVLNRGISGSEINTDVHIPDIAELLQLFGIEGGMHEPLHVAGMARLENGGLVFRVDDGNLGQVRLKLEGQIEDLERPAGIDAQVDVSFPGTRFLRVWLPDVDLPNLPLAVRGHLVNGPDRTELDGVQLTFGEVKSNISGHFTHDLHFDLDIEASGPDITILDELIGVQMQDVPFSASARLSGNPETFALNGMDLVSGKSIIRGDMEFELGEVGRISGHLVSPYINLNPWTASEDESPPPESTSEYVFDDTPTARVTDIGIEIDTHLEADVMEIANARYEQLEIGLHLAGQRLEVKPFVLTGMLGGAASGELVLDSSSGTSELDVNLQLDGLRSGLGAKEGQDPATLPTGNLYLELQGRGNTRREVAEGLNGKVRLDLGPGKLAPSAIGFLVSDFASQLLYTLNPNAEKQEYTELECAVAAADIVSGQVSVKPVVIHTRQLTIVSQGKIDLDTERLDLQFNTKQRKGIGISASDLVNPFIKVGGTMASPMLELDPAGTVVKGGIAVATAGLSILASSLAERYLSSKDPCGDALREIETGDGAGG